MNIDTGDTKARFNTDIRRKGFPDVFGHERTDSSRLQ
jgi:hypothetical protein